jgi:hypothetical protein
LAFFVLALASSPVPAQEDPPEGVAIYRSDTNDRAFAFSPRAHDFKPFYGPYRSSIWRSDIGGYFFVQHKNGIRYERFTSISLPDDLEKTRAWQVEGLQCQSAMISADQWSMQCKGTAKLNYVYRKSVGITVFTVPCDKIKRCQYELKTKTGILYEQY